MAPGYTDVKRARLGPLSDAVDAWASVEGAFGRAETAFRDKVEKGLRNSDWEGEAAETAFEKFGDVKYQFDAAASEAKGVHRMLSGALRTFRTAKEDLDAITEALRGHEHLSVHSDDGSVYVDPDKVDAGEVAPLTRSYQPSIDAYAKVTSEAVEAAQQADDTLRWALKDLSEYTMGFNNGAYTSLKDARENRKRQGAGDGKKISLKELSDQEVASRTNSAPAFIQFLSARSLIVGGDQALHGDPLKGLNTATGWLPSYGAGKASEQLEQKWKGGPGAGGRHRKPSFINKTGKLGTKIFGWPVSLVATGIDFAYTPEFDPEEKREKSRVMAPAAPKPQKWR